jgi:hypothetical protein
VTSQKTKINKFIITPWHLPPRRQELGMGSEIESRSDGQTLGTMPKTSKFTRLERFFQSGRKYLFSKRTRLLDRLEGLPAHTGAFFGKRLKWQANNSLKSLFFANKQELTNTNLGGGGGSNLKIEAASEISFFYFFVLTKEYFWKLLELLANRKTTKVYFFV